jgi:hypothetical protein
MSAEAFADGIRSRNPLAGEFHLPGVQAEARALLIGQSLQR